MTGPRMAGDADGWRSGGIGDFTRDLPAFSPQYQGDPAHDRSGDRIKRRFCGATRAHFPTLIAAMV